MKTNFIAGVALLVASTVATPADAKCAGVRCWVIGFVLEEGFARGTRLVKKYIENKKKQRSPGLCRPAGLCNDPGQDDVKTTCQDLPGAAPHCGRAPGGLGSTSVVS